MAVCKEKASTIFSRIMLQFPETISCAFAYGSGVFQQNGHVNSANNMIDLVFAVDKPLEWHSENLKKNLSHYSMLRRGGSKLICKVQEQIGAGIYYNTLIPFDKRVIKYGVISTKRLVSDLLYWNTLYVAGRLHKPVRWIIKPSESYVNKALQVNLENACHAAMLSLPEEFTEKELLMTIAGLSYSGDLRMKFGEDKNKVENIILPLINRFRDLYVDAIDRLQHVEWNKQKSVLSQDCSADSRLYHLSRLPESLKLEFLKSVNLDGRYRDMEDVLRAVAVDYNCGDIVSRGIKSIVSESSTTQSIKGLLTAGIVKSVKYSAVKIKKMMLSKVQSKF